MLSIFIKGVFSIEDDNKPILDIPLKMIDDFPEHPFRVCEDEDMKLLVESIKKHGVITPAIVRTKKDDRYELISGHRRKYACELLGLKKLRCEVLDLTKNEATIYMVESNWQRTKILPSEKAFSYKMWLDALKHQGQRTDLTSAPVGQKLKGAETVSSIAEQTNDSKTQIQRYIRLTYLIPELLTCVDEGKMKLRPAVELSYLDSECQYNVWYEMDRNICTPSHAQAIRIRKAYQEGNLTTTEIQKIMQEGKPNQREKIVLSGDRVRQLIPRNIPLEQTEDFVCKALVYYNKLLRKRAEREDR
ncbi:MAG: ParB/RepB/Spo0J family partition protein [Lachnospiraceae bacterium]